MVIICSICQEVLTERPQIVADDEVLVISALSCGHLFHQKCVRQWFTGRTFPEPLLDDRVKDCPCCKTPTSMRRSLQVYPTCDDDVTRNFGDAQGNEELLQKLNELQEQFDEVKVELAESRSKVDELQGRVDLQEEDKQFKLAVENSVKTALEEKAESEKRELLKLVAKLEQQKEDWKKLATERYDKIRELEADRSKSNGDRIFDITVPIMPNQNATILCDATDDEGDDIDDVIPIFCSTRIGS